MRKYPLSTFLFDPHNDPNNAPSDGPNMLNLKDLKKLLTELKEFDKIAKKNA